MFYRTVGHTTYCYCCRASSDHNLAVVLVRYKSGFRSRYQLCRQCAQWLFEVLDVARGEPIEWIGDSQ